MAKIEILTYNDAGEVVERGEGEAADGVDPYTAQSLCRFSTVGRGEATWMELKVNGKTVDCCDL